MKKQKEGLRDRVDGREEKHWGMEGEIEGVKMRQADGGMKRRR